MAQNRMFFSLVVKEIAACKPANIDLVGQCLKFCEETFYLKMVDTTAISGQIFLIVMLDQFSQGRKMRLQ